MIAVLLASLLTACSGSGNEGDTASAAAETPSATPDYGKSAELLVASADGTETFYQELNDTFAKTRKETTGQTVTFQSSSAPSSEQEQAVISGTLKADVVTLGVGIDIDAIQAKGIIGEGWQQRYDYNSSPYSTAVAFLVRAGNPKGVQEWKDLLKPDIAIVTSDASVYSDARWYYAGAWAYAMNDSGDDQESSKKFVTDVFAHVKTLAPNDGEALADFLQKGEGDVLLTTEYKALEAANGAGKGKVEVVVPAITLSVEPIVSVVDKNADAKGVREAANAYVDFLYTEEAQKIAAKHFFRPRFLSVAEQFAGQFPEVTLLTVDDNLTGWEDLQAALFSDGGLVTQLKASK